MNNPDEEAGEDFARLNLSSLQFPSDALSIGTLRNRYPELFDVGIAEGSEAQPKFFLVPERRDHSVDSVGNMLYCERMIATFAYARKKGLKPPEIELKSIKNELAQSYSWFGLAKGPHHAERLIREIERGAKELVRDKPK